MLKCQCEHKVEVVNPKAGEQAAHIRLCLKYSFVFPQLSASLTTAAAQHASAKCAQVHIVHCFGRHNGILQGPSD